MDCLIVNCTTKTVLQQKPKQSRANISSVDFFPLKSQVQVDRKRDPYCAVRVTYPLFN